MASICCSPHLEQPGESAGKQWSTSTIPSPGNHAGHEPGGLNKLADEWRRNHWASVCKTISPHCFNRFSRWPQAYFHKQILFSPRLRHWPELQNSSTWQVQYMAIYAWPLLCTVHTAVSRLALWFRFLWVQRKFHRTLHWEVSSWCFSD